MLDGIVFFGGMLALIVVAGGLRLVDARRGFSAEEKKARLKQRLPFVMGTFFGLVFYVFFRSM
jgi:hypothetical protein